jgi:hypothetical protein
MVNRDKNISKMIFLLAVFTTAFSLVLFSNQNLRNSPALAHGGQNAECKDVPDVESGSGSLKTYTAPSGQVVTGVCIKSGTNMFSDSHSGVLGNGNYENNCFVVSGIGTQTVTVTKIGSGNNCQDISHIDVYTGPTPTSTPSLSSSLTPSPTPTGSSTPGGSPESTPSSSSDNPSGNNPSSGGRGGGPSSAGDVLGASTFAPTGNALQFINNLTLTLGSLFLTLAGALNVKKQKSKR